jgi:predicted nicotinamide N-methyase
MSPEFSLDAFLENYQTEVVDLTINDKAFKFLVPKSLDGFVDTEDVFNNFPLWAKIWEASIVLSEYLAGMAPDPKKNFLEIGCGMGIVGIVASAFGHKFVSTEFNPDAIAFCRANSALNATSGTPSPVITKLDWNRPSIKGHFDMIVGSEVIYNEKDFEPILRLFRTFLKPGGDIILAEGVRKTSMEFFRRMSKYFSINGRKKILRSSEKETRVLLCTMKFL